MLQNLTIAGMVISLYKVFDTLAGVVLLCFLFLQTAKYRELLPTILKGQRKRTMIVFAELIIISVLLLPLWFFLNRSFAKWFTNGNANYYGNITAWMIVLTLLPIVFKVSPLKTMDLLTPALPLSLFTAKLACFFHGCCSGIEMQGSFYYNQYTERYEFPVQLLEALVALGIFFFLQIRKKKIPMGEVFPVYLIVYSASRFLTEFLRDDLPRVFSAFNAYQILSVIYFLLGVYLYMLVREKGKTIQSYFDAKRKQS